MTIAFATRKILITALFVPMIAMTAVSVEPFAGLSGAHAQQSPNNPAPTPPPPAGTPPTGDFDGDGPYSSMIPPCVPGTPVTPNCRPWTPPRQVSSAEECECQIVYKTIGGKRVAIKDCYVLLPSQKVRYCDDNRLRR
ncbi:MAG: hypothetical protein WAU86_06055 [Oricola sp.]